MIFVIGQEQKHFWLNHVNRASEKHTKTIKLMHDIQTYNYGITFLQNFISSTVNLWKLRKLDRGENTQEENAILIDGEKHGQGTLSIFVEHTVNVG